MTVSPRFTQTLDFLAPHLDASELAARTRNHPNALVRELSVRLETAEFEWDALSSLGLRSVEDVQELHDKYEKSVCPDVHAGVEAECERLRDDNTILRELLLRNGVAAIDIDEALRD